MDNWRVPLRLWVGIAVAFGVARILAQVGWVLVAPAVHRVAGWLWGQ